MRIIHTADLHLDSPLSTRLNEDKAQIRKRELFESFERLVDEAKRLQAEAFIIAGDLFDRKEISKRRAERLLDRIRANGDISFLYLGGNHESDGLLRSGAELPENLLVFGRDWTYFDFPAVTVAGRTETSADMFSTLKRTDKPIITVLHGELGTRSDSSGVIGGQDAREAGVDYLALGHYHSYSASRFGDTVAVYSGTPEGRGFDEAFECGFVLLEVNDKITHTFCPFAKRRIRIIDADVTGKETHSELRSAVEGALSDAAARDTVRIRLVGARSPEVFIDTTALASALEDRCFYLEIKDETRQRVSAEDYLYDKSFKGEFIRSVLALEDATEEEKSDIIKCGLSALLGEDITL